MSVYFNGKEIKEIYYNGKKINEAYFNGKKVHKLWYYCYTAIAVDGTPLGDDEKDTFYLYAIRFNNYETDGKYGTTYGVIGTTLFPAYSLAPKSSFLQYVRTHVFKQNDENSATAVFGSGASRVMTMARYRPGDFYTPENHYGPYPEPDPQTT